MTLAELPDYARVGQVAELLGLSRSEVYRMAESGELPSTRVSEIGVRIPKAELVAWLRTRTRGAVETVRPRPTVFEGASVRALLPRPRRGLAPSRSTR